MLRGDKPHKQIESPNQIIEHFSKYKINAYFPIRFNPPPLKFNQISAYSA